MMKYHDKDGNERSPFKWELKAEGYSDKEIKSILKENKPIPKNKTDDENAVHPRLQKASKKHLDDFNQNKIRPTESVKLWLVGYIGTMMGKGKDAQKNGVLILTNERICFIRKGLLGEVFETIDFEKVSSFDIRSSMGHRVLTLHTSNNEIEFKTLETKDRLTSFASKLEREKNSKTPNSTTQESSDDPLSKLKGLKELFDSGVLSEDEFNSKKADLLSRI